MQGSVNLATPDFWNLDWYWDWGEQVISAGLKDVSKPEFADALTQQLGKHRITIMLDDAVVRAYKARAGGRGYQTLINETLRRGLQADAAKDDLREVVRQVIREELRAN